ncbi:MAG: hypothetical protein WCL18_10265 [bacterium]
MFEQVIDEREDKGSVFLYKNQKKSSTSGVDFIVVENTHLVSLSFFRYINLE